jgi:hypothetical protein
MPDPVPTFLVAGAGRSGTTGLVEGLRTHPSVFITNPKEPHYFALHGTVPAFTAPGDDATINRVAVTDKDAYLALFAGSEQATARGDGAVSTLYYHDRALPEIAAVNPDMRVVIILREPVDRAFSSYQYMRARGFEPEEQFSKALSAEAERQLAGWHHLWHYTAMSKYADAVTAFVEQLGTDQVGVWFYDELEADYEGTVAEVLRFIGAPPVEGEATGVPRVNISGTPRSAVAHRLIWAATKNEPVRRTVKRMTSYRMREFVRRRALRRDGVGDSDRAQLAPLFEEDLARLASLLTANYQRPLPDWLAVHR